MIPEPSETTEMFVGSFELPEFLSGERPNEKGSMRILSHTEFIQYLKEAEDAFFGVFYCYGSNEEGLARLVASIAFTKEACEVFVFRVRTEDFEAQVRREVNTRQP